MEDSCKAERALRQEWLITRYSLFNVWCCGNTEWSWQSVIFKYLSWKREGVNVQTFLTHQNWERWLVETSFLSPATRIILVHQSKLSQGKTFDTSLYLCLQVSYLQPWGHHSSRGANPKDSRICFFSWISEWETHQATKQECQGGAWSTLRRADEEYVQEFKSTCWQCLWSHWVCLFDCSHLSQNCLDGNVIST